MKKMIKLPAILLGLLLLVTGITQKAMAQDEISMETFYDELSPYGTWIDDPTYGYVWRPDVDRNDFRPYYTNGRWAMTEYGNTWVSDYDWGWAPFHYGRWVLNDFNDWIWIPDTVWGPAWVSWRSGGGYYGWAPLGPGIDINVNIGGGFDIPFAWWVFIPQRTIYSNYYPRYYGRSRSIFNRTNYVNYTYRRDRHTYFTGPRADDIRRVTNRNVTVYNVSRSNRPGRTSISNNNINIYSPRGGRSGNNSYGGRPDQPNRNNAGNVRPGQPGRTNPVRGNDQGQRPDQPGRATQPQRGNDQGQRPDQPGRATQPQRGNDQGQRPDQPRRATQPQRGNDQGQRDDQQRQEKQRQQQEQQRQQREGQQRQEQQRQQQDQQRQEQQRQQQDQQRQQQEQQRQQREGQQRQEQQRQQQEQQRQQQDQQRQQRESQQRQQQDQQRQEQQRQQQDQQRQQRESQQRNTEGQSSRTGRGTRG